MGRFPGRYAFRRRGSLCSETLYRRSSRADNPHLWPFYHHLLAKLANWRAALGEHPFLFMWLSALCQFD